MRDDFSHRVFRFAGLPAIRPVAKLIRHLLSSPLAAFAQPVSRPTRFVR